MPKLLGWNFHLLDGRARCRVARGPNQPIALQPDGIVLGTIDANEQAAVIGARIGSPLVPIYLPKSGPAAPEHPFGEYDRSVRRIVPTAVPS
jgi:ribose transport system substrate-binding protein